MDLYIANTKRQIEDFIYRLPDSSGPKSVPIQIGSQTRIRDLASSDINEIVKQHERYGMRRVSEIDRTKPFIGLCWDDKPINVSKILNVMEHNQEVLVDRGRQMRREAAVAANSVIDKHLAEMNKQTRGDLSVNLNELEMSVEEEPRAGADDDSRLLEEGVVVSKTATPDKAPRSRKQTRRDRFRA